MQVLVIIILSAIVTYLVLSCIEIAVIKNKRKRKVVDEEIKSKKKKMRIPKIYRIIIWAIVVKLLWELSGLLINYLETLV